MEPSQKIKGTKIIKKKHLAVNKPCLTKFWNTHFEIHTPNDRKCISPIWWPRKWLRIVVLKIWICRFAQQKLSNSTGNTSTTNNWTHSSKWFSLKQPTGKGTNQLRFEVRWLEKKSNPQIIVEKWWFTHGRIRKETCETNMSQIFHVTTETLLKLNNDNQNSISLHFPKKLGCFQKIVGFPPKWMVYIMENPIKHGMIWGKNPHIFWKHPNP